MTPYEIIARKRDGFELSEKEIDFFISGYMKDEIKDYQMAAFLMAVFLRGMSYNETYYLTKSYIDSGSRIDLSHIAAPKVDKHSTGGVGDKVSILLAPLVASQGIVVPMMSGRGLGHSGGTLDKLESIPGFNTQLSIPRFKAQLESIGVSMIGQTPELVPADRRIYALRDVTATVESIPLITASIMSKKISEGIDALVLDVKYGNGAFMSRIEDAEKLAQNLIKVGNAFGKRVKAVLTSMEQPLGNKVGNWLEVLECLECFRGEGPVDVREVTLELAANMLILGEPGLSKKQALRKCEGALSGGEAFNKFLELVRAQGGQTEVLEHPESYPLARHRATLKATDSGYISHINTREVGLTSVILGAGRVRASDPVDPQAGMVLFKKLGYKVAAGEPILEIHTNKKGVLNEALERLQRAFRIEKEPPTKMPPLILKEIHN